MEQAHPAGAGLYIENGRRLPADHIEMNQAAHSLGHLLNISVTA